MANLIQIDELNTTIQEALTDYNKSVVEGLKKTTKQAMNDLVKETKATAPVGKRSKHYKDSITSRTESETEYGLSKLWYVKPPNYRLTHLLNDGNALRKGGRYPGTNFLGKAVENIVTWYKSKIEEVVKNG